MNPLATTFFELFADNLPHRPDKVFLIDPDRAWTYGEVDDEVNQIAAALVAQAVQPGDG
jgi:non-ribosomal peptide synthetase component E (peptide arylation enzyme)